MSPSGGSPAPARPTVGTAEHDPAVLPLHLWPSTLGFAGVWLISFGFVLVELLRRAFTPGDGRGEAILGVAAIVVFILVYLAAFVVPRPVRAWPAWANAVLTWLVLAGCLAVLTRILGVHALLYSPFLVATWLFPHRLRVGLIGAGVTMAAALATGLLFFPGDSALPVVLGNLAVLLVVLVGMRLAIARDDRVVEMTHELDLAGQRERLGRDLHDILGHSLTTINVKTQLVHRLIDTDPARAKEEAAEVITLSRTALAEARAAVAELAAPELGGQLSLSVGALRDAGMAVEAPPPGAVTEVPERRRALAAWIVREAVTNVLRHAGARRVRISLDAHHVAVLDDGAGLPAPVAAGVGPRTLAQRAAAEGARLEVGPGLGGAGTGVAVHWGGSTPEAARGVLPAAEGRMDA
ncbi:sensor histidine kinase [Micrococcus yunnanensis]|uniref:sensor histidine kinase n=1 Tax=Micrococcus yunnanensis TaxID=566027 RepID=UPI001EED0781|nr:histidine kinase [Micrococcus yunnanensis]MCF8558609.1 histidine kinase [Micrococcus yunnanensis]